MASQPQPSSSSLRRTPGRKSRSSRAYGDKPSQPRAEFRGKYAEMDYISDHNSFNELSRGKDNNPRILCRNQAYAAREPVPWIESPKFGLVGPEMDLSVRARNMPMTFLTQLRDKAPRQWKAVYDCLFPDGKLYYCHAKDRPKVGCMLTKFWSDTQVRVWTQTAHRLGVNYHGMWEYSFRKGTNGYSAYGRAYPSKGPWLEGGELKPPRVPYKRKRSEGSRMLRKFRSSRKFEVGFIDFKDFLVKRKIYTRRVINSMYYHANLRISMKEFRESIPECLSVAVGPPLQVSPVVKRAIRNLAVKVKKFDPLKPWVLDEKPIKVLGMPIQLKRSTVGRLRATFCNDGKAYITRSSLSNKHSVNTDRFDPVKVAATLDEVQDFIDNAPSEEDVYEKYGYSILGNWN